MRKISILISLIAFLFFSTNQSLANDNYFGDGSDGDVTYSTNTSLSNTEDGDYVVMQYSSLTINSGVTLTTQNRAKGLFIYVTGDATINGTISMTARGANADPTTAGVSATGLRLPLFKSGETDTLSAADFAGAGSDIISAVSNQSGISGNGKIYQIPRTGATGGTGCTSSGPGTTGSAGSNGQTGGGGSGACTDSNDSGAGGDGTCFSGGSATAGTHWCAGSDASDTGGAAGTGCCYYSASGGGAANPGGAGCCYGGVCSSGSYGNTGSTGTGGVIWLIVGGDLTIGATGVIEANGSNGGNANFTAGGGQDTGGGGSGGGSIHVLYAGALSNSGTIEATGGSGGSTAVTSRPGGDGGAGFAVIEQINGITSCLPTLGDSNHTISSNCNFTGYTDAENGSRIVSGLDSGTSTTNTSTLTIANGTLTVNANETLVSGSFELTGGSIAIAEGGELVADGMLWAIDADGDGYPKTTTYYAQTTQPTDGVRLNTISDNVSTADSDDNRHPYFGNGNDGAVTISANTNINTTNSIDGRSCADGGDAVNYSVSSLTSNTATLSTTPSSGCLTAGDEVLLINQQGTTSNFGNVGNYETLTIQSISTNTITFTENKTNNYGDSTGDTNIGTGSTNQRVMLQRVPNYTSVTVNSSYSFYPSTWDGTKNGIIFFRATGTVSVAGTIHTDGYGYDGGVDGSGDWYGGRAGGSFCAGDGTSGTGYGGHGRSTEGSNGYSGTCGGGGGAGAYYHWSKVGGSGSASQGGSGGGGGGAQDPAGTDDGYAGGGAGGGYGSGGERGYPTSPSGQWGVSGSTNTSGDGGDTYNTATNVYGAGGGGGGTYGDANLTQLFFGSGGGGGGDGDYDTYARDGGHGGDGGGIIYIAANTITVTGSISSDGANGSAGELSSAWAGAGGGGAGGSISFEANDLTLGSSLVTANGGTGNTSGGDGGDGGSGRIHINYFNSLSGTTSPSADTDQL